MKGLTYLVSWRCLGNGGIGRYEEKSGGYGLSEHGLGLNLRRCLLQPAVYYIGIYHRNNGQHGRVNQ